MEQQRRHVRIVSFNVNGLRAILKRLYGPKATIAALLSTVGRDADIVCLQETKLRRAELTSAPEIAVADGWEAFFSCADSPRGYSGTATFCRTGVCLPFSAELSFSRAVPSVDSGESGAETMSCLPPRAASPRPFTAADIHPDLKEAEFTPEELSLLDSEGRVVVTDHGAFILWNVYGPAITSGDPQQESVRMSFKMGFYSALQRRWAGQHSRGRPVVVVGDLNIAPAPIDYPDHDPEYYRPSRPDRIWMRDLLSSSTGCRREAAVGSIPFLDCFRAFHPNRRNAFTVWSMATGARANNYGSRIDLCLAAGLPVQSGVTSSIGGQSGDSTAWIAGSDIEPETLGSDHCPVWVDIGFHGTPPCSSVAPWCAVKYSMAGKQTKLSAWLNQDNGSKEQEGMPGEGGGLRSCGGVVKPKQLSVKNFFSRSGSSSKERSPPPAPPQNSSSQYSSLIEAERDAAAFLREKQFSEAKNAWQRIQQRLAVPNCKHGDSAALKRVSKSGPNHGRYFYMCSRPAGKGPQAQCSFFQWVEKKAGDAQRRSKDVATSYENAGAKRSKLDTKTEEK